MFVIIEWSGYSVMGLVMDENGETVLWHDRKKAEIWAKENCAFDWKVVELC